MLELWSFLKRAIFSNWAQGQVRPISRGLWINTLKKKQYKVNFFNIKVRMQMQNVLQFQKGKKISNVSKYITRSV
jgi:hypothetical protein